MTLASVRAEALRRLATLRLVASSVRAHEASSGGDDVTRASKGLMFVQNYAVYEYVVVEAVRALVAEINARTIPHQTLRAELLGLALDAEFASVVDVTLAKTWSKRAELALKSRSASPVRVPDNLFPKDGSHFRVAQLQTVWTLFGLPLPVLPDMRLRSHIEEMVEKRNAIAHGREAPDVVGSNFSIADMEKRVADTEVIVTHVVGVAMMHSQQPLAFV